MRLFALVRSVFYAWVASARGPRCREEASVSAQRTSPWVWVHVHMGERA
jgi:hypothetical protein